MTFAIGDRAPDFLGAAINGVAWSLESLAGRPRGAVGVGRGQSRRGGGASRGCRRRRPRSAAETIQALALAPMTVALSRALGRRSLANEMVAYLPAGCGLEALAAGGERRRC